MAKRSWDKDRERRQMRDSEPAEPKTPKWQETLGVRWINGVDTYTTLPATRKKPPPALPDWMRDKSLLPRKPPSAGGPK